MTPNSRLSLANTDHVTPNSLFSLVNTFRLLILQEGKFWPARLNSTKLPDVWGLVMDRQRGNRPIILPRDDILKEAVSDNQAEAGQMTCLN